MQLSKTRYTLYKNLNTAKMRRRYSLFTAEGVKAVEDLSLHYRMEALLIVPGICETSRLSSLAAAADAPVYEVTQKEMADLSGFSTPSRVMGVFRIPEPSAPQICNDTLYLMLDGVRDPGNMGTIIRTCHWFGIRTILASYDCVDCFNPKTVQATMGSLGAVGVYYCSLPDIVRSNPGIPVYGTLLEGTDLFDAPTSRSGFIVMGNEGKGLSEEMRQLITTPLTIPPYDADHGESLNVAVATAIVIAHFRI